MFDEIERLRDSPELRRLLEHYASLAATGPEVWQDRCAALPGVPAKGLVSLHGELLAFEWIEQNTGVVVFGKPGIVAGCYRVTAAGLNALREGADETRQAA
jgi:hypothetical protein